MTIFVNGQQVGASGGLPTATGANQLPVSTGAGTTYVATDAAGTRTALGLGALATASAVTASQISDSTAAGRTILTAADAAAQRAAIGAPRVTTLYASDCTAEAGSEAASISGTGVASTFTLTGSSAARTYSSSGTTAARVLCAIPSGAIRIEVEIGVTAASGWTTSGARYLAAVLRSSGGGTPAFAWGASWNDNATTYWGNQTTGANAGGFLGVPSSPAADRWMRATWDMTQPQLGMMFGTGSGGARPSAWAPPNGSVTMPTGTTAFLVDNGAASALAVYLQSFGGGGATSVTASLTIRVLSL